MDETARAIPEEIPDGRLRFEGTVELAGAVTDQMLGTLFGPDSALDGRLRFAGPVQIHGTFHGALDTSDNLVVGERARIDADVTCGSAVVRGTIVGNITSSGAVDLTGTARVKGDITAPSLSVARGAMFDGTSRMGTLPAKRGDRR